MTSIATFQRRLRDVVDGRSLKPKDFGEPNWDFLKDQTLQLRHPKLIALPDGVQFSSLILDGVHRLSRLPASLESLQQLVLTDATHLRSLPDNLAVHRRCQLHNCLELNHLPDKLNPHVLSLINCPRVRELPPMPKLTSLILTADSYKLDISHLPISEVMMEDKEDPTNIRTIPKEEYTQLHRQYAYRHRPAEQMPKSMRLEQGTTDVELA